jgi:hypothetical protein
VITRVLLAVLHGYKRWLSPLLPKACRYEPTCSVYMAQAISLHGPAKGVWLGARRLCRCHPWGGQGWDPVPGAQASPCCESEHAAERSDHG